MIRAAQRLGSVHASRICLGSQTSSSRAHRRPHQTPLAHFSTTPRRCASEDPNAQEMVKIQEMMEKMQNVMETRPALVEHITQLKDMLEKEGIDMTTPNPSLSSFKMIRILMKPDVRELMMKVVVEFENAGITKEELIPRLQEFGRMMTKGK
ncbi:hypothetical protein CERSUDRAFT_80748 [Gelatoporia subvermispora B]|uniref:Uncharacterized protein n=1 Tax=Ceriporiopsis subvermispora (strain B) TaxID=914234 RepID=M2RQE9_CERS8|nr:hypothetical protein CERSUDRAFT_80748 [Gelatoporia subvermispora B]